MTRLLLALALLAPGAFAAQTPGKTPVVPEAVGRVNPAVLPRAPEVLPNGSVPKVDLPPSLPTSALSGRQETVPSTFRVPVPAATFKLGDIPQVRAALDALRATFGTLPANQGRLEAPSAAQGLADIAQANLQVQGEARTLETTRRFFDRASQLPQTVSAEGGAGEKPSGGQEGSSQGDSQGESKPDQHLPLPPGVRTVSVDVVREASDIDRLIPAGSNSNELIAHLKRDLGKMAPYYVYTYYDGLGGSFTGIDLSANPALVDKLPDQQSHEIRLIKKIQVWNKDLRVVVREEGKTPDLVIGDRVTELKSLIGEKVDITYLLNKANTQVYEHGKRHGLGNGAVAIDLWHETSVPTERILKDLNAWAALPEGQKVQARHIGGKPKKRPVVLDKVYVFAGTDLQVFSRQDDGTYARDGSPGIPLVAEAKAGEIKPEEVEEVRTLARSGKIDAAGRKLARLETFVPSPFIHGDILDARDELEAYRFLGRLRRLVERRDVLTAWKYWQNFWRTHSREASQAIRREVADLFEGEAEAPVGKGR